MGSPPGRRAWPTVEKIQYRPIRERENFQRPFGKATIYGQNRARLSGGLFAARVVMLADDLRARTRQFALDVVTFCVRLPLDDLCRVVRPQLLRAATGVAANYRAACRSRSRREFAARLSVVIEEADESELWLDVLKVNQRGVKEEALRLMAEATELTAIMAASRSTTLGKLARRTASR